MIRAVVLHHDRAAIIELPKEPIELEMELAAIGIQETPKMIWIQDKDGRPVRIQLFSQFDRENHAAGLFTAGNTLEEVNQCAHLLQSMHEGIADAVEEKLLRYKYATPQELMDDIRSMTEDLIAVTVDYYCPLKFQMTDEEYGDWYEVDNSYGLANEGAIRKRLRAEQDRDLNDMAAYFHGSVSAKAKILSAVWDVENIGGELFGVIHTKLTGPFSPKEEREWIDELIGQAADGFGEGFEQQGIKIEGGHLYVSFWNSSDGYFMKNESDFRQRISGSPHFGNMQM